MSKAEPPGPSAVMARVKQINREAAARKLEAEGSVEAKKRKEKDEAAREELCTRCAARHARLIEAHDKAVAEYHHAADDTSGLLASQQRDIDSRLSVDRCIDGDTQLTDERRAELRSIARHRNWTSCAPPARAYERRKHTQSVHEQYIAHLGPDAQKQYRKLLQQREELEKELESMEPSGGDLRRWVASSPSPAATYHFNPRVAAEAELRDVKDALQRMQEEVLRDGRQRTQQSPDSRRSSLKRMWTYLASPTILAHWG